MIWNNEQTRHDRSSFVVCSPYYYGNDCSTRCAHCEGDGLCNNMTGHCLHGCKPNWQGSRCDGIYVDYRYNTIFCPFLCNSFLKHKVFLAFIICPQTFLIGGNFVQYPINRIFWNHGLYFVRVNCLNCLSSTFLQKDNFTSQRGGTCEHIIY